MAIILTEAQKELRDKAIKRSFEQGRVLPLEEAFMLEPGELATDYETGEIYYIDDPSCRYKMSDEAIEKLKLERSGRSEV